jgi:uncharacterized membrane protein
VQRLPFLDRLRGLAVVVMIEVHVVNALLSPERRQSSAFRLLDAFNGLVAPAFLFCAGFAVALTLGRPFHDRRWRAALASHAKRSAMLLALGYLLHASALLSGAWGTFLQADILQTLAVTLLASAAVASLARTPERFRVAMLALALASVAATPFARAHEFSGLPRFVAPYLTDRVETQFPLFPWGGFVFAGSALGSLSRSDDDLARWRRRLEVFAVIAAIAAATAWGATSVFPPHDPWTAGPAYMLARLAVVCAGALALTTRLPASVERPVLLLGGRSLLVYFAHIALVYGRHPFSLRSLVGPTLGWTACAGVWLAVTIAMGALAVARNRMPAATS